MSGNIVVEEINGNIKYLKTKNFFLGFRNETVLKFGLILRRSLSEIINAKSDQHKSTKKLANL